MTRVLLVDDEPQILRGLRINLGARHYDVVTVADGTQALKAATSQRPELVVLDLGLPDMDGVDVIRALRAWTQVPILVLSGRVDGRDKVDALDAGADDYVTKPFSMDELIARLRSLARRGATHEEAVPIAQLGRHTIDLSAHRAYRTEQQTNTVHLTPTEWRILEILLRGRGKLITQRQLLHDVWGPSYQGETQYLRQYMTQLRRKLEPDPTRPAHLITEPGMGYRYQP